MFEVKDRLNLGNHEVLRAGVRLDECLAWSLASFLSMMLMLLHRYVRVDELLKDCGTLLDVRITRVVYVLINVCNS